MDEVSGFTAVIRSLIRHECTPHDFGKTFNRLVGPRDFVRRFPGADRRDRRTRAPRVKHLPDEYRCPITLNAMVDPCLAPDGHSYERRAIERWFAAHGTSPLTNQRLESTEVVPNHALRKAIARFRDECAAELGVEVGVWLGARSE